MEEMWWRQLREDEFTLKNLGAQGAGGFTEGGSGRLVNRQCRGSRPADEPEAKVSTLDHLCQARREKGICLQHIFKLSSSPRSLSSLHRPSDSMLSVIQGLPFLTQGLGRAPASAQRARGPGRASATLMLTWQLEKASL